MFSRLETILLAVAVIAGCIMMAIAGYVFANAWSESRAAQPPAAEFSAVEVESTAARPATDDTWSDVQSAGKMIVGTAADYPPFATHGQNGQLDGFDVALIREIGQHLGVEVEFQDMAFEELLNALQDGQVDVAIGAISVTPERQGEYAFTNAYYVGRDAILARPDAPLAVQSVDDMSDHRVGAQRGSVYETWLQAGLVDAGLIPQENLLAYRTIAEALPDLQERRVDLVALDLQPAQVAVKGGQAKIVGRDLNRQYYAMAVRQDAVSLQNELNRALAQVKDEGRLAALVEQYLEPGPSEPPVSPAPAPAPAPGTESSTGAPQIVTFSVEPEGPIQAGQCAALVWDVQGDVSQVTILRNAVPLWDAAPVAGSIQDCPPAPGQVSYTLQANGAGGSADSQRTLTVIEADASPLAVGPLAGTKQVTMIGGRPPMPGSPPMTAFFGADGTVTGSGGCNAYSGTYQLRGTSLNVQLFSAGQETCDPGVMAQEEAFWEALQSSDTFSICGGQLTIWDSAGENVLNMGQLVSPPCLFLVDIDGQRVVGQGYQEGGFKFWYPDLEDTFDMVLSEQLEWIEELDYAGIDDWRIGFWADTIPLKSCMFGDSSPGFHPVAGYDSSVYFDYTSQEDQGGRITYYTHGRTGDELGDPAAGGTGAIISIGPEVPFGLPMSERYIQDGVPVPGYAPGPDGKPRTFYTLLPTESEDHWVCFNDQSCMYNDDLNYTPEDLRYCLQGNPPERDCGVWTVSEAIPEIGPPDGQFHEITLSSATQPKGTLVPVAIASVRQDEGVHGEGAGQTAPDARVTYSDQAAVVQLRAEADDKGNGRVYHIRFTAGGATYTLRVGVAIDQDGESSLVDDGSLYDSTVE
jgi:polar amino acid transport system substrate-binding protein